MAVLDGELCLETVLDGEGTVVIRAIGGDYYTGPTVFTPTNEVQRIATKDLAMPDDVTINAIPDNYGLISWDGSTLTVS